ncbi:MAG: hypothetical protein HC898_06105 [Phycisphaerales bacterium]|nr:hypothetical protein [Phycisphaerales bacterium]
MREYLKAKDFTDEDLTKVENALSGAMELGFALNAWTLGDETVKRIRLEGKKDFLKALGLNRKQIDKLNVLVCGTGTVEGAPHLRDEHLSVFDCANRCGKIGRRFISVDGTFA